MVHFLLLSLNVTRWVIYIEWKFILTIVLGLESLKSEAVSDKDLLAGGTRMQGIAWQEGGHIQDLQCWL